MSILNYIDNLINKAKKYNDGYSGTTIDVTIFFMMIETMKNGNIL